MSASAGKPAAAAPIGLTVLPAGPFAGVAPARLRAGLAAALALWVALYATLPAF